MYLFIKTVRESYYKNNLILACLQEKQRELFVGTVTI